MRRVLGRIILFTGVLAILSSAVLSGHAYFDESRAKNSAEKTALEVSSKINEAVQSGKQLRAMGDAPEDVLLDVREEVREESVRTPRVIDISGGSYLGILRISALSLELPVNIKYTEAALKNSPCLYYGGLPGAVVIGAHNYAYHFGKISSLKKGDSVVIADGNGIEHWYAVDIIEVLSETDIEGRINSPYALTLFTCTKSRTERITVRCVRSTPEPRSNNARGTNPPKAPNRKIDYKNETLSIKKDSLYSTDGGENYTAAAEDVTLDVSAFITNSTPIHIKKAAKNKRGESAVQVILPAARSVLEREPLAPSRGRLSLDKKYEVYNPSSGKWGKLPKGGGEYEIRLKNAVRTVDGVQTGFAASLPGKLVITYGEYAPRKTGITAAEIGGGAVPPPAPRSALSHTEEAQETQPQPDEAVIRDGHSFYRSDTYSLADGVDYTSNSMLYKQTRLISENIFTLRPGASVIPILAGPDTMYGSGLNLQEAVNSAQRQGYDVIGGINAGHFFMSDRTPIGLQIRNGVLTSLNFYTQPAVGFLPGGSVIFGEPNVSVSVSDENGSVAVDRLNRARTPGHICLYTPDFGGSTQISQEGVQIVLRVDGSLSLGGSADGTVTRVIRGDTPYAIAAGEMVLSASTQAEIERMAFLTEGSAVTLTVSSSDNRFYDAAFAVGGLNNLVTDGQPQAFAGTERAPRTAIGIGADGEVILYTVDGRQPGHSAGLTLSELAERMGELGCVAAFTLDGGGSTTAFARLPGEPAARLVNRPSDGSMRRCADFILLTLRPEAA
jgi:LPXTG-site transpeptidase (sortase) family protein